MSANLTITLLVLATAGALVLIGNQALMVAVGVGCATFSMIYYHK
jgi:hypothetical protein